MSADQLRKESGPTEVRHTQGGKRSAYTKKRAKARPLAWIVFRCFGAMPRLPRTWTESRLRWTNFMNRRLCTVCGVHFKAPTAKVLSRRMYKHRKDHHPEHFVHKPSFHRQGDKLLWPCNVCGVKVSVSTKQNLEYARQRHIRGEHPDVAHDAFLTLTGRYGHRNCRADQGCARKRKQVHDQVKHHLLNDGDIESQPGPSLSARSLRLWSLNVGGTGNAYEFLQCVFQERPHVVLMQECRAKPTEVEQFKRHLQQHGLPALLSPGKQFPVDFSVLGFFCDPVRWLGGPVVL